MVRSFQSSWVCVVAALVLVTLPLSAGEESKGQGPGQGRRQVGGGPGGGPGGGFSGFAMEKPGLLRIEQVQKELKITDEQKTKLEAVLTSYQQKSRDQMGGNRGLRDLPQDEREKKMKEMQDARKTLLAETDKELAKVITAEQTTRLDEIQLQQQGVEALKNEPVAKKLEINADQAKKIDEAITWGQEEQRKLFQGMRGQGGQGGQGGADPAAFRQAQEKRDQVRKDTMAKAMEVLTKDQQEKFAKMKGKAFELDRAAMRGPGGPGGGRGGKKSAEEKKV